MAGKSAHHLLWKENRHEDLQKLLCLHGLSKESAEDGQKNESSFWVGLLKECVKNKDLRRGSRVHDEILRKRSLGNNVVLGTAVVDMYAKCGALAIARRVHEELAIRDIVSWNTMIAGYVQQGEGAQAMESFHQMQNEGLSPDAVTFSCIVKACGIIGADGEGERIHEEISKQGLLKRDIVLGNALVDMYAKCGALSKARKVLEDLPVRNVISWTTIIAGYVQQGNSTQALDCFEQMQCEGLSPNAVTYSSLLKACGSMRAADKGEEIHDAIAKQGLLGNNIVLGTALVDMYAKCGALAKARKVLEELPARNASSWSALIAGYVQQGEGELALMCFEEMQDENLSPDAVTFTCLLKACGSIRAAEKGEKIHEKVVKEGLLGNNIVVCNALVDMYVKCGVLAKARKVLEELPTRDVVSWSGLLVGYVQCGEGDQALSCLEAMQCEGLFPDGVTLSCILKACGSIGAADTGEKIHEVITKQGLLGNDIVLGNALVDMYAKCGALTKARRVLEELPVRHVISWNALLAGYAQHCKAAQALDCFERMLREQLFPDAATFTSMLTVCSRSGLVEYACILFISMSPKYGIEPNEEHFACMVDLFGRSGHLDKAMGVIEKTSATRDIWAALIGSCHKWGDVIVGRWAFEHAVKFDKKDAAFYVLMADTYRSVGMEEDAKIIEALQLENMQA